MKNFTFFGVREFNDVKNAADAHAEELQILGYTILEDVLSEEKLQYVRAKVDEIYAMQVEEIGGEEVLIRINDSNNARCLLAYDSVFLTDVAANERVLEVVSRVFGDYYTLMLQNGVINKPATEFEANAWAYHRDLNYQHFTTSRPVSLSALFCIDNFSVETGGTYILPSTHIIEKCPSKEYAEKHEVCVSAKAGSVILFNSMMYHRSGKNSSSAVRRAINNMYVLPFIKQQISIPDMLNGLYSDNTFYRRFLGYDSKSNNSVLEFRKQRLNRK